MVDTVARVGHGQSLLIGGIHRDELSEGVRKVPLLGDIPYLGALFRFQSNTVRRSVRLFLIEPRLIDDGLAHYAALGSQRGYLDGLLNVDQLSNQSLDLANAIGATQCQVLDTAQLLQDKLQQAGKSSHLSACRMDGESRGWRVIEGACDDATTHCVRPLKRP